MTTKEKCLAMMHKAAAARRLSGKIMAKRAEAGPAPIVKRAGMLNGLARPVRRLWQEMKWRRILNEGHMPQIHNMDELDRLTAMILRTKPPPPPRQLPPAHVLDDIYKFLGKPNTLPRR